MEYVCKNIRTYSSWNPKIDSLMVIDLIVMTTCISPFSIFLSILIQCQSFQSSQTCAFANLHMHFYMKGFHFRSDLDQSYNVLQITI
jgi:hypothetical protein